MTVEAKIIADSVSPCEIRLTTFQLRYPKFIHGEFMTHRAFSRNASSSRAIPVERLIVDVERDPAMPVSWGKNQRGMQDAGEHGERVRTADFGPPPDPETGSFGMSWDAEGAWLFARDNAVKMAHAFARAGYHKQIVNRLLEPFCHINVVATATDWKNFFALRYHPDADPTIRVLAAAMLVARNASVPIPLRPSIDWHTPYVPIDDPSRSLGDPFAPIKVSVARCARVSYLTHEGGKPTVEEDLALYERLMGAIPLHASPAEHQATPDDYDGEMHRWGCLRQHGNFRGWRQFRKMLPNEYAEG